MPPAKDHEACRALVCGLCMNQHGVKAKRKLREEEEEQVAEVIPGYRSSCSYFPSGICMRCIFLLTEKKKGKEVRLLLPEEYHVDLTRVTRSRAGEICECSICTLARISGPAFLRWQREMKGKVKPKVTRLCTNCYLGIEEGSRHTCATTTLKAVENLTTSLPEDVRAKLAYEYLASKAKGSEDATVLLPPAAGGKVTPVLFGRKAAETAVSAAASSPLTHEEAITIGFQNNLSSNQLEHIMADLRTKYGRDFVEPGLHVAAIDHNNMYAEFFKQEEIVLIDKDKEERKTFFFCFNIPGFLLKVCQNRGIELEQQKMKIGLDHGLEWEKFTLSLSPNLPSFQPGTSFFAPNTTFTPAEEEQDKKKRERRSREAGVTRGDKSDTGQRAILFLGVLHKIKENAHNLRAGAYIFDKKYCGFKWKWPNLEGSHFFYQSYHTF